jgi:arylsulfatase A-like enzyme
MRSALRFGILVLALASPSCSRGEPPAIRNVLLVSIDTLRADRVGGYGATRPLTPTLDRLAARGVRFANAVAQAPWTAPSHASMLTSLYPSVLGMGDFADPGRVAPQVETLAEAMRAGGLRTFAAVAGGFVTRALGFDQGFEGFEEIASNTRRGVDRALEFVDSLRGDERFFVFLHTYDVHKYNPPREWRERFVRPYDGPLRELAPTAIDDLLQDNARRNDARALDPASRGHVEDLYDAGVAWVDSELGRLVDELERRDLLDATLIAVVSDHGEEFWEHGATGHGYTVFDENLLVPWILSHPSLRVSSVESQVRLLDLAPTLAALAATPRSEQWQGEDLAPLIAGGARSLPAFAENAHLPVRALRHEGRKYVLSLRRPRNLFFELASDPREQDDLFSARGGATDPEIERFRLALVRWMEDSDRDGSLRAASGADLDDAKRRELSELGYTAPSTRGDGRDDLERWRAALEDG